ncbi:MAG: AfsR/SARP family transcriptional regulator, partial [Acidimicrobiales bacterium]
PWNTPGARVVLRSPPGRPGSWIVTIPGERLPALPKRKPAGLPEPRAKSVDVAGINVSARSDTEASAGSAASHTQKTDDGLTVRVLGPVEVVGWIQAPSRRVVTELGCFLALHGDRNATGEEIRAALWPGDLGASEASAKSLRNTVSLLRKALGPDLVPEAQRGSGYRFADGVRCDWTIFDRLVAEAEGPQEKEKLREALSLVRGAPFEGVPPGSFTWAWTELFVSRIEVAVASAANRLGELALAEGDVETAIWAALQGLSSAPNELSLWSLHLRASAKSNIGALERTWKSARAVLGDDSRDLIPLLQELRSEFPRT